MRAVHLPGVTGKASSVTNVAAVTHPVDLLVARGAQSLFPRRPSKSGWGFFGWPGCSCVHALARRRRVRRANPTRLQGSVRCDVPVAIPTRFQLHSTRPLAEPSGREAPSLGAASFLIGLYSVRSVLRLYELYSSAPQPTGANVGTWTTSSSRPQPSRMSMIRTSTAILRLAGLFGHPRPRPATAS
jgi:hypothetical protein